MDANDTVRLLILNDSRSEAERLINMLDRKSTRLNSSHVASSYAVFCLKKKRRGSFFTRSCFMMYIKDCCSSDSSCRFFLVLDLCFFRNHFVGISWVSFVCVCA